MNVKEEGEMKTHDVTLYFQNVSEVGRKGATLIEDPGGTDLGTKVPCRIK